MTFTVHSDSMSLTSHATWEKSFPKWEVNLSLTKAPIRCSQVTRKALLGLPGKSVHHPVWRILWPNFGPKCSGTKYAYEQPWLAQKSNNILLLRVRFGGAFLSITPLQVSQSLLTWALNTWILKSPMSTMVSVKGTLKSTCSTKKAEYSEYLTYMHKQQPSIWEWWVSPHYPTLSCGKSGVRESTTDLEV